MSLWRLVALEILHRKGSFAVGVISVALAWGAVFGGSAALRAHGRETRTILESAEAKLGAQVRALDDKMRTAMLSLGFNLVIVPGGQNIGDWYSDDYATKDMSESCLEALRRARPVNSAHFVGALRRKLVWPERKWTVILVGFDRQILHPYSEALELKPRSACRGEVQLGAEIHRGLGLKEGDDVDLLGRKLRISNCLVEQGGPGDVTVWMNLKEMQELLNQEGRINEIHALATVSGLRAPAAIRAELAAVLPGTQVIERGPQIQTTRLVRTGVTQEGEQIVARLRQQRDEMRSRIERLVLALALPVVAFAVGWVWISAFGNVRDRRNEVGILLAIGYSPGRIAGACLMRFAAMGLVGGIAGVLAGGLAGDMAVAMQLGGVALATAVSSVSAWLAVRSVLHEDPAAILRE